MKLRCRSTKIPIGSRSCTPSTLYNDACLATSLFPPQQRKTFHESVLQEILQERVSSSRNRINPRGVKRKMSNYHLRPRQRGRTRRINFAKRIILLSEQY